MTVITRTYKDDKIEPVKESQRDRETGGEVRADSQPNNGMTEDDPDYRKLKEVYNKTKTTEEDWEPLRAEVQSWLAQTGMKNSKSNAAREAETTFI